MCWFARFNYNRNPIILPSFFLLNSQFLQLNQADIFGSPHQNELTFKGVGGYLSRFVKSAQAKLDDVKNVERSIYANVLTVMAVFVAVFGLFSLNASFISQDTTFAKVFLVNAYTIGVIAFLAAIVKRMISSTTDNCLVIIGCLAFVFALIDSCFILA